MRDWIPITDRLPDYDVEVLATCGKEIGHVKREFTDGEGEHWVLVDSGEAFEDVTDWMPVPALPVREVPP